METFQRYFMSSLVTFTTAFMIAILPFLGSLPWDKGAIFALVFVGARAGIKAATEEFVKALDGSPADLPR